MNAPSLSALALCVASLAVSRLAADVTLPRVLGSRMVLQRGMEIPVWGEAAPGEQVTVAFRDATAKTAAGPDGRWALRLPAMQPGEPARMVVAGKNQLVLEDVLVGEVWVGSGQSNIDSDVPDYVAADSALKTAAEQAQPRLRLYRSDVGEGWGEVTPVALKRYSAQLFYFGVALERELGVPVGLMEGAVRGSPAVRWVTPEMLAAEPSVAAAIADWDEKYPMAERTKKYREELSAWEARVAQLAPGAKKPAAPVEPAAGGFVRGETGNFYREHILPMMPYAVRGVLWDQGEGGTGMTGVRQPQLMRALIKGWRAAWGRADMAFLYVQKPSGGGPALDPGDPVTRGAVAFAQPPARPDQAPGAWNNRLEYLYARDMPATYMVPTSDLVPGVHPANKSGYASRAARVALGAVYGKPIVWSGPAYDSCAVENGRLRIRFTQVGKGLAHPAGQPLQGFAIAGADRRFRWAEAQIDGETVLLSSPEVPAPVAARYAWTQAWDGMIPWANLFNADGLPAAPFRTDPSL